MSLLVTILVVIRDILVEVLERAPRVEVVPKVVEAVDIFLGGIVVAKHGHGLLLGEAGFGFEDLAPELIVITLGQLPLGGRVNIGLLIDRVKLSALDGVEEQLGGFLDALEEVIVLGTTLGSLLVGVMLQNLLAMGTLDLVLGGLPAVLGQAEDLIVIL